MKVTAIVGLPGSGKTHYAEEHYPGVPMFDDIGTEGGPSPDVVISALIDHEHIVVIDPNFCAPGIRRVMEETFKILGAEVEYVWFENDPDTCRENVENRNDGRPVDSSIEILSKIYAPQGPSVPCWSSETQASRWAASQVSGKGDLEAGLPITYLRDGAIVREYPDGTVATLRAYAPEGSLISRVTIVPKYPLTERKPTDPPFQIIPNHTREGNELRAALQSHMHRGEIL